MRQYDWRVLNVLKVIPRPREFEEKIIQEIQKNKGTEFGNLINGKSISEIAKEQEFVILNYFNCIPKLKNKTFGEDIFSDGDNRFSYGGRRGLIDPMAFYYCFYNVEDNFVRRVLLESEIRDTFRIKAPYCGGMT